MATLDDVRQIPNSYFQSNLPNLPLPIARYHYLTYLMDNDQLDSTTANLMQQPDFYSKYVSGDHWRPEESQWQRSLESEWYSQLLPNDTLLTMALTFTNLDDVISMSMVSTDLNDKLKSPVYLNVIKDNVGVTRPIIDSIQCSSDGECTSPWSELAILRKMASRSNICNTTYVAA